MKKLYTTIFLILTGIILQGQDCLNTEFDEYDPGTVITNQIPDLVISADNNNGPDIAMIFDSNNPTGGDPDLGVMLGNILIISEDGDSNDPDDDLSGGVFTFSFTNEVFINQLTFIDIENSNTEVRLFDINNSLMATVPVPQTGDGGVVEVLLDDYSNIHTMEVELGGSGAIDDFEYCQVDAPVLPVEWSQFIVENQNGNAHLTWTTASEVNNEYFEIQRSGDNRRWLTIGKVSGSGTTHKKNRYDYVDELPLFGINYYRIKQVDNDGNEDFSDVRKISFMNGADEISLSIFPNPTVDNISIISNANIPQGKIIVSDVTGRTIFNGTVQSRVDIDLSHYSEGIFIARIENNNGQLVATHKIIKTNP